MPIHTVNTKKALSPIPGARPNGNLAHSDITSVPVMEASAVAVNTAPAGMPSSRLNILGFTARMYDMVRKVVIPASISVRSVVTDGSNPKIFFSIFLQPSQPFPGHPRGKTTVLSSFLFFFVSTPP